MNISDIKKWGLARLSSAQKSHAGVATVNSSGQVCGPSGSPVSGGGSLSVTAQLLASNTGAQNMALLAAAHDSLAGTGGTIMLPAGTFNLAGNLTISAANSNDLFGSSTTIAGQGMGATRLVCQRTDGATFTKSSGHAHSFRDLTLIGPGTSFTDSVGIDWTNAAGGAVWSNIWIQGFGCGSQFYDATSMSFVNCHLHGNNVNLRLGYNCDIFQFFGGRIQNAVTNGLHVGWRGPGQPAGSVLCSPIKLIGPRFGDCGGAAVLLDDAGASQFEIDSGYWEHNTRIMDIGTAGSATSPKIVTIRNSFFTRAIDVSATQIQVLNDNSDCSLNIEKCTSDETYTGNFAKIGSVGSLTWVKNRIPLSGAGRHVKIGTLAARSFGDEAEWHWNTVATCLGDGSLLAASNPVRATHMTNGTNKSFEEWSRRSAADGTAVGSAQAYVRDIDGKWVLFDGLVRIGTPSAALPTAAATYRGVTAYQQGAAGVADTILCCMKSAGDTYSWKQVAGG